MNDARAVPLLRTFILAVAVVAAVGGGALWVFFDQAAARFALEEGKRLNLLMAQSVANTIGATFADAAPRLDGLDRERLTAAPETAEFRRRVREIAASARAQQASSLQIRDHLLTAEDSVRRVGEDVGRADRSASATGETATGVLSMANRLGGQAAELSAALAKFLTEARAA